MQENCRNIFSKESIACAIYRPKGDSDPVDICTSLVRQSDVAIIDWQLAVEGDKSEPCRRIIKEVLENDKSEGNPLRLIVVYTGESLTDSLVNELKRDLEAFETSTLSGWRRFRAFGFECENCVCWEAK